MASRRVHRPPRPTSRRGFDIAIICALTLEADAIDALFDTYWDDEGPPYDKAPGNPNVYSTGVIGRHNVVLAHMSGMGKISAALVASRCQTSFPNIKLALVVGICGVVPFDSGDKEILLGDVIISDGVVQYDLGRHMSDRFERKDTLLDNLGRPNVEIRTILAKLKGLRGRRQLYGDMLNSLDTLQREPMLAAGYPGKASDILYEAKYQHEDRDRTCDELGCNGTILVRERLQNSQDDDLQPVVHFGLIASGDSVMRSGEDRDAIAQREGVIAFEMESAGIWDIFPCVVIKGACDYADSHKSKAWQKYAAATAAACAKAFLGQWTPSQELHAEAEKPPGPWFIVPYLRNEGFVERLPVLEALRRQLGLGMDTVTSSTARSRVALHGLGGIGKTQIALDYVYWLQATCPDMSIFWVHASNAERFIDAYTSIARECNIPGHDQPNADVLMLVKDWLETTYRSHWLMVIDNADDTELFFSIPNQNHTSSSSDGSKAESNLNHYLPVCKHGSLLITSRNKQTALRLAPGKPPVEVGRMTDGEARQLVCATMGDDEYGVSAEDTTNLATRLEHLPLALAQATAFIQENSILISEYIQLLDESDSALVDRLSEPFEAVGRDSDTPHALTATWIISFEQIERQHAFASSVLSMACFLDRQAIPETFVTNYLRDYRSEELGEGSELVALTKALGTLQAFSFISKGKDKTMDMHRLVQLVTRKWLITKGKLADFAGHALKVVSKAFPFGKYETRELCLQYLPHANAVLSGNGHVAKSEGEELARAILLHHIAAFHEYQGKWKEAERLQDEAIKLYQRVLGDEHPRTLEAVGLLVSIYISQGRLKEAEPLADQQLATARRLFGDEHPTALISMSDLISIYRDQGRWKESESLNRIRLDVCRRVLGEEHPTTLADMGRLSSIVMFQGRLEEAESLQLQVLKVNQRVLGKEHPSTIISMTNLASIYVNQGRWEEAESLQLKAMEGNKRALGEEHPSTLVSMNNLASTFYTQRRWEEAESIQEHVLEIQERVLGEEHKHTLATKLNLAATYMNRGRLDHAGSLGGAVLVARLRLLGQAHPDTLLTMHNLAFIWRQQGDTLKAIELMERCCQLKEVILGSSHYQTIQSASALKDWKDEEDADGNGGSP